MNGAPHDPISLQERAEPVVVVAYDARWPALFVELRARLAAVLGDLAAGIEHVGSTAVPGLDAKPIVDLDVVLRHEDDLGEAIRRLGAVGYEYLGDLGVVGREAFRAPAGAPRHHLYVCPAGSHALQAHLTLRDALRENADLRARYAALKRELAERFRDDRDAYTEGKTAFIMAVLVAARDDRRRLYRS